MILPAERRKSLASLLTMAGLLVLSPAAKAGRPLIVDDAQPVAPGLLEMELGSTFFKNGSLQHWHFPVGLTIGLAPAWEVSLASGAQLAEGGDDFSHDQPVSGVHDLVLASKVKLPSPAKWGMQHALAVALKFPSGRDDLSTGEFDFDLTWIVSVPVCEASSIHFNGGLILRGDPPDERLSDIAHYGLAFDYQVSSRCQLVAEVFADTPVNPRDESVCAVNGGLRWQLASSLVLDTAVGTGLRGDMPDVFATIGLTWTLDLPWRNQR